MSKLLLMGLSSDIKRNFVTIFEITQNKLEVITGFHERISLSIDPRCMWSSLVPYLERFNMLYLNSETLYTKTINDDSIFIIEPHYLVPVTTSINAYSCPRKVYVQNLGISSGGDMERMVQGNILHDIFAQKVSLEIPVDDGIQHALEINYLDLITKGIKKERIMKYLEQTTPPLNMIVGKGKAEIDFENWRFGIHGKLDGKINNMVLELKSSRIPEDKPYFEHNLQMNFYLAMLKEREPDIRGAILYVSGGEMGARDPTPIKLRPMLLARNWAYLTSIGKYIPPLLRGESTRHCKWCFHRKGCSELCAGLETQRDCEACPLAPECTREKWNKGVQQYFQKFIQALTLEEVESQKVRYRYSRVGTGDKEALDELVKSGQALVTTKKISERIEKGVVISRFSHDIEINVFRRGDFLGVYPMYSTHPTVTKYESAIILEINENEIIVRSSNFLPDDAIFVPSSSNSNSRRSRGAVFRASLIDHDLMKIVVSGVGGQNEIRSESIDPKTMLREYNEYQLNAIQRALGTNDIYLIQGPAGTGKTSVIVEIIHQLYMKKKSVLACAFTNMAVDNIGLKLKEVGIPFIRLGRENSVNRELVEFLPRDSSAFDSLLLHFESSIILATTSTIAGEQYRDLTFEYAIIDEAAQMTEPDSLKPLLLARKAVLVGDHKQLPPVIVSEEARALGLEYSMFERLVKRLYNTRFTPLLTQYRMNEEILVFPNAEFYNNKLQSSPTVAKRTLNCAKTELLPLSPYWVYHIDAPNLVNQNQINPYEAWLCAALISDLLSNSPELTTEDIGVITPFRAQVGLLRRLLPNIAVDTVDRFQGSEREVIIFSTITSREVPIVTDPRRMNVALTRAKSKMLVLVTNANDTPYTICEKLVSDARRRDMISEFNGRFSDATSFLTGNRIDYSDINARLKKHLSSPNIADVPVGDVIAEVEVSIHQFDIYLGADPLPILKIQGTIDESCGICFMNLVADDEVTKCLTCENYYHKEHLVNALKIKSQCPICRISLKLITNFT